MFTAYKLPEVQFQFGQGLHTDKFRGLQSLGPFKALKLGSDLKLGFVFPSNYRDEANKLYLGLKNGVGYFKGIEATFRVPLRRDQVVPVSGFVLPAQMDHQQAARLYADAILSWCSRVKAHELPNLFIVLHPRTPSWEQETPYYECKSLLLKDGLLSQDVTVELINDSRQFEWSVANIALGAFVKLGGIPWVISGEEAEKNLVIGIGRSDLVDQRQRTRVSTIGFTTCFSARGDFKFMLLTEIARTRQQYLASLAQIVRESLNKAKTYGLNVSGITMHLPKEFSREEAEVVTKTMKDQSLDRLPLFSAVKVTDEANYFFVDESAPDGIPNKGTVAQVSDLDFVLYTEGRDESQSWRYRTPTALRVRPLLESMRGSVIQQVVREINDLSQVNWRGFNAKSRPVTVHYSMLIAGILGRFPSQHLQDLYSNQVRSILESRLWFL
jgi:hypothetical protein